MKRLVLILIVLPVFSVMMLAQSAKQYYKAGEEFSKKMNFKDAIQQYNRAIELDPDYEKAYVKRAMSYSKLGDYSHAAEDFDRALVFSEKDAELYYFSGNAHHLQGRNNFALGKQNTAIKLKGNFLQAYQVRTIIYLELEKYEEALEDC